MVCVAAPACKAMLAEATRRWPERSRASDGICPSAAHSVANPSSDHELGQAVDVTHDPEHGVDCAVLAELVKDDPRTKYVIFNRRIWNSAVSLSWRPYAPGTTKPGNPHTHHMHVSIRSDARDDGGPWFALPATVAPEDPAVEYRYPSGQVVELNPPPVYLVDLGQSTVGVAVNGNLYPTGHGAPAVEAAIAAALYRENFHDRTVPTMPSWDGHTLTIVSHLGEVYAIPITFPAPPQTVDPGIVARCAACEQTIALARVQAAELVATLG